MLHIIRSLSLSWTHLCCFHRSICHLVSIKSFCRKTADHLSWPPEMTLATWRGVTGRNIPTQGVKSTCNPTFENVSNGFLPKEASFIFSHWLIVERSQNWPDLGSSISEFRETHFYILLRYQSLKVLRWSGIRCSYDERSNFSEMMSLDVTWWPDLEYPGSEIFTCVEQMYEEVYQKQRHFVLPFFRYLRKTLRGVFKHLPPARRGLRIKHI